MRRDERVARLWQAAAARRSRLLRPPEGVDLDARDPVAAAQPLVVGPLEAVLTDHVAGRVALEVLVLELLVEISPRVAEHLRRHGALRVGAQVVLLDLDAGERLRVLQEVRDHPLAHVLLDDDQVESADLAVDDLLPGEVAAPLRPRPAQVLGRRWSMISRRILAGRILSTRARRTIPGRARPRARP